MRLEIYMFKMKKTSKANVPWMDIAMGEIGTTEIKGAKDNDRIVEYHQSVALRASDDETPWCASFANFCLKEAGIEGTDSAAALSFRKWGQEVKVSHLRYGDICVIDRGGGRGHVGFFVGFDRSGRLLLLGGNQDDQVNTTAFPSDAFAYFRRPRKLTDTNTAKITIGGGAAATFIPAAVNSMTGHADGTAVLESATEIAKVNGGAGMDTGLATDVVNIVESVAPGYGEVARLLIVIGTACFILYNRFKDLRNRGI